MLRLYASSRALYSSCRLASHLMSKRCQSSKAPAITELEPNTSNASIFSGHIKGAMTNKLEFIRPENITPIPIYQVLDPDGKVKDASQTPDVRRNDLRLSHRSYAHRSPPSHFLVPRIERERLDRFSFSSPTNIWSRCIKT